MINAFATSDCVFTDWANHKILTVLTGSSRRSQTRMYAEETEKPSRDSSLYFTTTTLFGCPNTDWISQPVCKSHTFTLRSGNKTRRTKQLMLESYRNDAATVKMWPIKHIDILYVLQGLNICTVIFVSITAEQDI